MKFWYLIFLITFFSCESKTQRSNEDITIKDSLSNSRYRIDSLNAAERERHHMDSFFAASRHHTDSIEAVSKPRIHIYSFIKNLIIVDSLNKDSAHIRKTVDSLVNFFIKTRGHKYHEANVFNSPDNFFKLYTFSREVCGANCNISWASAIEWTSNGKTTRQEMNIFEVQEIFLLPKKDIQKYLIIHNEYSRFGTNYFGTVFSILGDSIILENEPIKFVETRDCHSRGYFYYDTKSLTINYKLCGNKLGHDNCCDTIREGKLEYKNQKFRIIKDSSYLGKDN